MRGSPRGLPASVAHCVAAQALWSPGDTVGVAVSGGADSVALLHLLYRGQALHGGKLVVITVDHGARPDSVADARFVWQLAQRLSLPCVRVALGLGVASEADYREARYQALAEAGCDRVALGHHADDQAETVLQRLTRGSGPAGLAGMAWRRGVYVRPLLDRRRDALRAWLRAIGEPWRDDPSNADPRYWRNQLRADVLPALEAGRPGAITALARTAAAIAEDEAWLSAQAAALGGPPFDAALLRAAPWPLVRRALARAGVARSAQLDAIRALLGGTLGRVALDDGRVARIDDGALLLDDPATACVDEQANHDELWRPGR